MRSAIELCLEMTPDQGGVAHVFELPGFQFRADTREEFLTRGGAEAGGYLTWCQKRGLGDLNPHVKALIRANRRAEGGTGPAFHSRIVESVPGQPLWKSGHHAALFEKDRLPLDDDGVRAHIRVVRAAYTDMAKVLTGLSPSDLAESVPPAERTLDETIAHLGDVAWWYSSRLSDDLPEPGAEVPPSGMDRLKFLLALAERWYLEYPAAQRGDVMTPARIQVGGPGEPWSHHKAVRRHAEHMLEHLPGIVRASRVLRRDNESNPSAALGLS